MILNKTTQNSILSFIRCRIIVRSCPNGSLKQGTWSYIMTIPKQRLAITRFWQSMYIRIVAAEGRKRMWCLFSIAEQFRCCKEDAEYRFDSKESYRWFWNSDVFLYWSCSIACLGCSGNDWLFVDIIPKDLSSIIIQIIDTMPWEVYLSTISISKRCMAVPPHRISSSREDYQKTGLLCLWNHHQSIHYGPGNPSEVILSGGKFSFQNELDKLIFYDQSLSSMVHQISLLFHCLSILNGMRIALVITTNENMGQWTYKLNLLNCMKSHCWISSNLVNYQVLTPQSIFSVTIDSYRPNIFIATYSVKSFSNNVSSYDFYTSNSARINKLSTFSFGFDYLIIDDTNVFVLWHRSTIEWANHCF